MASDPRVCPAFVQFQCDGLSAAGVAAAAGFAEICSNLQKPTQSISQEVGAGDPVTEKGGSCDLPAQRPT